MVVICEIKHGLTPELVGVGGGEGNYFPICTLVAFLDCALYIKEGGEKGRNLGN